MLWMAGILENLTPQIITDLYNGKSPHKMNLTSKQLIYATNLWAVMGNTGCLIPRRAAYYSRFLEAKESV